MADLLLLFCANMNGEAVNALDARALSRLQRTLSGIDGVPCRAAHFCFADDARTDRIDRDRRLADERVDDVRFVEPHLSHHDRPDEEERDERHEREREDLRPQRSAESEADDQPFDERAETE